MVQTEIVSVDLYGILLLKVGYLTQKAPLLMVVINVSIYITTRGMSGDRRSNFGVCTIISLYVRPSVVS